MTRSFSPVLHEPLSLLSFLRGVCALVNAIRPTLGPIHRVVVLQDRRYQKMPEVLDDGGLVARRILELTNRSENPGAMFLRQLLWRLREQVGDGTATAAVLFESIYSQGCRYIIAGGDPVSLHKALEDRLKEILKYFDSLIYQNSSELKWDGYLRTLYGDDPIVNRLVEIYEVIEGKGFVEVLRVGEARDSHEYIQGAFWNTGLFAPQLLLNPWSLRSEILDGALLITNFEIKNASEIAKVLYEAEKRFPNGLCIVARSIDESVLRLLVQINHNSTPFKVIAVKTPGTSVFEEFQNLQDMAVLAGGMLLIQESGTSLEGVTEADFGSARKIWADRENFGIIRGKGSALKIRSHLNLLQQAMQDVDEVETLQRLQRRIGNLNSGIVRLKVGGSDQLEQDLRLQKAEKMARLIPLFRKGWVAGGGVSLVQCSRALSKNADLSSKGDVDEIANKMLSKALVQPALTILSNAGYSCKTYPIESNYPFGIDVRDGKCKDFIAEGIVDPAEVVRRALIVAIKGAALALTTGTIVYSKNPQRSIKP